MGRPLTFAELNPDPQTDLDLMQAVWDILYDISDPAITPRSPLALAATAGDTGFTPADPSQYTAGGIAHIVDTTGEEDLAISADWDGETLPVPLTFAGMGYDGLQFDHAAGVVVSTNLFTDVPPVVDGMLTGQNSLVFVTADEGMTYSAAQLQDEVVYTMRLGMLRRLYQPATDRYAGVNMALWGLAQRRVLRQQMEQCRQAITGNPKLFSPADGRNHALALGDPINPLKPHFQSSFRDVAKTEQISDFVAEGEFTVRAPRENTPPGV